MTFQPSLPTLIPVGIVAVLVLATLLRRGSSRWLRLRRLLLVLALLAAAARPGWGGTAPGQKAAQHVDVVVAVDRTASMGALDGAGGRARMAQAIADVTALVQASPGARFTLISFDNAARVEVPATSDSASVISAAETLGWQEAKSAQGSDIALGLPTIVAELERLRERDPQGQRIVVYLGDGEQTAATVPASFAALSGLAAHTYVLGYGTPAGAQMQRSPFDETRLQFQGAPALSVADPAALRRIAEQTAGTFVDRSAGNALPQLPVATGAQATPQRPQERTELYPYALVLVAVLAMAELALALRAARSARKEIVR